MARMLNSLVSSLLVSPSTLDFNSSFSALRPRISFADDLTDAVNGLFFDGVFLDGLLVTRPLRSRRAFAAELTDAVDGLFFDGVLLDGEGLDAAVRELAGARALDGAEDELDGVRDGRGVEGVGRGVAGGEARGREAAGRGRVEGHLEREGRGGGRRLGQDRREEREPLVEGDVLRARVGDRDRRARRVREAEVVDLDGAVRLVVDAEREGARVALRDALADAAVEEAHQVARARVVRVGHGGIVDGERRARVDRPGPGGRGARRAREELELLRARDAELLLREELARENRRFGAGGPRSGVPQSV